MTTKYDDIISDIYKDAYGFRPSGAWKYDWAEMTEAERDAEVEYLEKIIVEGMEREAREAGLAAEEFEAEVAETMNLGAPDRATALRWMTQNEEFHHEQDVEHFVWKRGFLFTDLGRAVVRELMGIVEFLEWP